MDELDILKQDWKKQEAGLPRLSFDEIYKMLWKRSSSIVKWIFIISILELFLSTFLSIVFADKAYWDEMERLHLVNFTYVYYVVSYCITFFFIYRFYQNYRKISTTDDAATLMKNILKTRKTVKIYIGYVLASTAFSAIVISYFTIKNHRAAEAVEESQKYSFETMDWIKFILIGLIALAICLAIVWLFYRLIYGILLRKLKRNYKELSKLEM
ncbi:hypothetical protein [Salinimicrobium sp. GXAS 041]|uniref:hypothetical protein n=1 Tax=Salinimicrobium sp. GXAS 041 TaxID=3400806 RepID=UPI003C77359A